MPSVRGSGAALSLQPRPSCAQREACIKNLWDVPISYLLELYRRLEAIFGPGCQAHQYRSARYSLRPAFLMLFIPLSQ